MRCTSPTVMEGSPSDRRAFPHGRANAPRYLELHPKIIVDSARTFMYFPVALQLFYQSLLADSPRVVL